MIGKREVLEAASSFSLLFNVLSGKRLCPGLDIRRIGTVSHT